MKHIILAFFICVFSHSIQAQTINLYGSLFSIGSSNSESSTFNENAITSKDIDETFDLHFAFGGSFQKGNNFSYLEFTFHTRNNYNKTINHTLENIYESDHPYKNTYGLRLGKGKKYRKSKNFTLAASAFFHGSYRESGINNNGIRLHKYLNTDNDKITNIIYSELPQEVNLELGLRLGLEYYFTSRFYINLNFDFIGSYKRTSGTTKHVNTQLDSDDKIITIESNFQKTKRNNFNTRFLITSVSVGFNIWKSRHQHE